MEEVERLYGRVTTVGHGGFVALGTPEDLIDSLGAENRVVFRADGRPDEESLGAIPGVNIRTAGRMGPSTDPLHRDCRWMPPNHGL